MNSSQIGKLVHFFSKEKDLSRSNLDQKLDISLFHDRKRHSGSEFYTVSNLR